VQQDPNRYVRKALRLARELMLLADHGDLNRQDDGCGVLSGVVRDCAYQVRAAAEREREAHRRRGMWVETDGDDDARAGPAAYSAGSPSTRRKPKRKATPLNASGPV